MNVPGYSAVAELARTGRWAIVRARPAAQGNTVLLKLPAREPWAPPDLEALEQEFALLGERAIEGMPRPLDLVRSAAGIALVLEDRGLTPLSAVYRPPRLTARAFLEVAIGISNLLAQLHRHDVISGGVSPASLLAGDAGGTVQLIDYPFARRPLGDGGGPQPAPTSDVSPYISPEQTGRLSRGADHRSDLYSAGATLYALLTGSPPFASEDPLELIHGHVAKVPLSPDQVAPGTSKQISRIVMRLLAKAAEDRYQSALGLRYDLEECLRQWTTTGTVTVFDLGRRDVSDRLLIPQRLYGRDAEIATLKQTFDETCEGRPALLLVSGYSGIGKTALINELYRPIVRERGYFAAGKFDQVARNVPYGALIEAFRGLVWQLLTESEERLVYWRDTLSRALGGAAGVLAEVLPDVEHILGPQPAPPPLEPAEAQNRFRFVFLELIRALAQRPHPLVVFLDDLQWADSATLDLLHAVVTGVDEQPVLFIGAFRETEVGPQHSLPRAIERLEASNARVTRLALGPLTSDDLQLFLRDALRAGRATVEPLAGLILEKTQGNPFFVIQFLKNLHQQGLVRFDHDEARWSFDMRAIAAADLTDNVIDLMTGKIRGLSPDAQRLLTLAACVGSRFERESLVTVSGRDHAEVAAGLTEAVSAGLIRPVASPYDGPHASAADGGTFAFLHDRVQQAAYGLIPDALKPPVHLDVGRMMLARHGPDVPDDRLFEIVSHLDIGRALIADEREKLSVARLNLAAGRRAKTSAAYQTALDYFLAGRALLDAEPWERDYDLAFALHLEAAECQYLAGHFEQAGQDLDRLLPHARTKHDQAGVHSLRIVFYENLSRYADAEASGRAGLSLFGISLPEAGGEASALDAEIARIEALLGNRAIVSLADLPPMTDPDVRTVMRMLTLLWAPAYLIGHEALTRLISATMVRLSLEHGNAEDSAYGYVTHAVTTGPIRGDYRAAYQWGELALAVNERLHDARSRAKIHQQFHAHVKFWCRPFDTCLAHAREARRSGLEGGDFTYAGYGAATESWPAWVTSRSLDQFVREYTPTLGLLEKLAMSDFRASLRLILNWAEALRGRTASPLSLSDSAFDEEAYARDYEGTPFFLSFLHVARLHLAVLFEDVPRAVEAAARARETTNVGTMWPVLVEFWGGLAMAAAWPSATAEEQHAFATRLLATREWLKELEGNCPENFRCFRLLLDAEQERAAGRPGQAIGPFVEAVTYAQQTDNLQMEALAHELCARAWLACGDTRQAAPSMARARRCYEAWGALAKVRWIEERHAELLAMAAAVEAPAAAAGAHPLPALDAQALDLTTVLKVARAIAVEIRREDLVRTLMTLALENAGARRGLFLMERDGTLVIEAEATADPARVDLRPTPAVDDGERLALTVVRYVRRTGQAVVVADAKADGRFGSDEYVARAGARSILCVPVGQSERPAAILYLENDLTSGAFTAARAEMMRVLAAQAAISLENSRLYEDMTTEVERRTAAEQALRGALAELEQLKNRLEAENVYLQEEIRTQHNFNDIVGNHPRLLDALHKVERVAPTESTVLILGETGSGKELFARAVHSRSRRSHRPLVKVNCGAIAPGLVESELFGHVKGAFTGAIDKRTGRFELADGGTIFLDEVGELPLEAQVKLLRVLQEQEFEPVGSSRTVRVDVRVIAATNRNLEQAVREGRFRADLLYRLDVFPIEVPPLRERVSDIPLLAGFFVSQLARRLGKPLEGFSARSMERLVRYAWPGNVRELQNIVERAAILASGPVLDLERDVLDSAATAQPAAAARADAARLDDVQRAHIVGVLSQTGGVIEGTKGAAAILGMHPNTLRSRMKKLGIAGVPGRPS